MCMRCSTEAELYEKEVVPGIGLVRATVDHGEVRAGDWGLVECNDPFFWWRGEILPVPRTVREDAESPIAYLEGEEAIEDRYFDERGKVERMLIPADVGYRVTVGAIEVGYDPKEDGYVAGWIYDRLDEVVRGGVRVETESPPDPRSEDESTPVSASR